eukprot:g8206.t2
MAARRIPPAVTAQRHWRSALPWPWFWPWEHPSWSFLTRFEMQASASSPESSSSEDSSSPFGANHEILTGVWVKELQIWENDNSAATSWTHPEQGSTRRSIIGNSSFARGSSSTGVATSTLESHPDRISWFVKIIVRFMKQRPRRRLPAIGGRAPLAAPRLNSSDEGTQHCASWPSLKAFASLLSRSCTSIRS